MHDTTNNPPTEEQTARVPSEPPNVKAARAWGDALENVAWIAAATVALCAGKISVELWFGACAAAAGIGGIGGAVSTVLGRRVPTSLSALAFALLEGLHRIGKAILPLALMLAASWAMFGCLGSSERRPDWTVITEDANRLDVELNRFAQDRMRLGGVLGMACAALGSESDECEWLSRLWGGLQRGLGVAHAAVEVYRATGMGLDAAERHLEAVGSALDELGEQLERFGDLAGEMAHETSDGGGPRGSGGGGRGGVVPGGAGGGSAGAGAGL